MGNMCFVSGMEMVVSGGADGKGGRTVCEDKHIIKFNIIARKQVKNGRTFNGYVVFRQREICFTCNIPLFERNKCVYGVPKQIGCVRESEELYLFRLRIAMSFASLAE
jgi:hypothetical protein